ncbi:hypothetical protein ACJX0J_033582 [Zea mays]
MYMWKDHFVELCGIDSIKLMISILSATFANNFCNKMVLFHIGTAIFLIEFIFILECEGIFDEHITRFGDLFFSFVFSMGPFHLYNDYSKPCNFMKRFHHMQRNLPACDRSVDVAVLEIKLDLCPIAAIV